MPTLESLSERVDGLARENRWLKRIGASTVAGLLALVVCGTSAFRAPRELSAERFVLKDPDGRPRARLELKEHGPALSLLTPDGRDQVLLLSGDDGSSSLEYFQGVDLRASLTHYVNLGPALNLFDPGRRGRAEIFVNSEGGSGVALHRSQWGTGLKMGPDGTSKLSFLDQRGDERIGLAVSPEGTPSALGKFPPQNLGLGTSGLSGSVPKSEGSADRRSQAADEVEAQASERPAPQGGPPLIGRAVGAS